MCKHSLDFSQRNANTLNVTRKESQPDSSISQKFIPHWKTKKVLTLERPQYMMPLLSPKKRTKHKSQSFHMNPWLFVSCCWKRDISMTAHIPGNFPYRMITTFTISSVLVLHTDSPGKLHLQHTSSDLLDPRLSAAPLLLYTAMA